MPGRLRRASTRKAIWIWEGIWSNLERERLDYLEWNVVVRADGC